MPVTTRFSESLDKTYDESNPSSPPPMSLTAQAISAASGSSGTTHSSPNGSISSYSRTNSVDSLDDSHSSSSGGCGGHSRQLSNDSSVNSGDYIPTRSVKQANKTPLNPLQFVKTGTSQLYKKATEQMKKYEEVKKLKTVEKEEPEEWQHNLDNWKSKRRQISHKTVERAEELRKLEAEEAERQASKRKNKTFSEMMQERSRRGSSGRKLSYWEDDEDDIPTTPSSDYSNSASNDGWNRSNGDSNKLHLDDTFESNKFGNDDCNDAPSMEATHPEQGKESPQSPSTPASSYKVNNLNGNSNSVRKRETKDSYVEPDNGSKSPAATLPAEEYTFEKAIQSYVQYAENHQRKNMERRDHAKTANNGVKYSRSDTGLDSRHLNDDVCDSVSSSSSSSNPEPIIERSGGTAMTIIAKIVKTGSEQRDFGFTTRSQGRGLVFVDTVASFGPADNAGLRRDDEILAVNGESVSNRSHSAIVFAIKQAVYTGCLELQVYRYTTEEALNLSQFPQSCNNIPKKKPSRVEERKAVFSREHSFERESTPEKKTFVREQSPRVDIRKRRSLFEGTAPDVDRKQAQMNRTSDASSLRGRISSFDNLSAAEKQQDLNKEKLEKEKLPEKISDVKPVNERCSQFKNRLASFEKADPGATVNKQRIETRKEPTERKQSLKEKLAMFERQENFERSRSCDLLDVGRMQEDVFDIPKTIMPRVDDLAWIDAAHSEDIGPPRIIDVMTKESSPEPNLKELHIQLQQDDDLKKDFKEPQSVVEVMVKKIVPNNVQQDIPEHNVDEITPSLYSQKSGFELAESLDETPIIASNPSSPCQKKRPSLNSELSEPKNDPEREITNQLANAEQNSFNYSAESNEPLLKHSSENVNFNDSFDDYIDAPCRLKEPPKEKPPPPPQDVDSETTPDQMVAKLRRAESTKRIRKQTWQRRSDFLGIDPNESVDYMDVEVSKPPPDLESILRAEKSLDEQLRKNSYNVSRNKPESNEPTTIVNGKKNEDDDIAKKEREIIENLEREEQRQQNEITPYFDDDPQERLEGEKLMSELDLLQEERFRLEEVRKLHEREKRLRQHEPISGSDNTHPDEQEQVRLEKEKLRREQEALMKEKVEYQKQIQQYQQKYSPAIRRKNVILPQQSASRSNQDKSISMPRSQKTDSKSFKPVNNSALYPSTPEARERDEVIKLSRCPASEVHGQQQQQQQQENVGKNENSQRIDNQHQQMSKNTLQAISASPKAKLTDGEKWIARRKPEATRRDPSLYNQHWLIQEAEMRRISDHQNRLRQAKSPPRYQQKPPQPQQPFPQTRPDKLVLDSYHNSRQITKNPDDFGVRNVHERNDSSDLGISPVTPPPKNYSTPSPVSPGAGLGESQMLSVSGKKKCSHCSEELGRGAAMIIESLQLYYHIHCFKCCVCHVQLGNGLSGADVRVRNQKLHCHNCYSNDEAGLKFSKV